MFDFGYFIEGRGFESQRTLKIVTYLIASEAKVPSNRFHLTGKLESLLYLSHLDKSNANLIPVPNLMPVLEPMFL